MLLHPTPVTTARFNYQAGQFTAEISDLGPGFRFERVWNDSCDEGLTLVSKRTGFELVFAVVHTERREGEILWWELAAVTRNRCHKGLTIKLFND